MPSKKNHWYMKTFMNETHEIEVYLSGQANPVLEARLLLDKNLQQKVQAQQKTYLLVQEYGRKKLRTEIEQVHQQLFTQNEYLSFRKKILEFFRR
jgi:hypothetical protein